MSKGCPRGGSTVCAQRQKCGLLGSPVGLGAFRVSVGILGIAVIPKLET